MKHIISGEHFSVYNLFLINPFSHSILGEQVMVMNLELDVPPTMDYLPHGTPVHTVDRETMAEAQFLAQQRKYWPSGFI